MNRQDSSHLDMLSPEELRQIDLLVDGELEPGAQKQLLAKIDRLRPANVHDPWRQLALAYVESQAWQGDFCAAREELPLSASVSPASRQPIAAPITTRGSSAGMVKSLLAMAACALLAFGLGRYLAGGEQAPATEGAAAVSPLASDKLEPIVVPIFVNNRGDDLFQDSSQPVMPLHLIEALEQAGQPIDRGRTLVPIHLEDGTEIEMPVDELKLRLNETSRRVDALREKLESIPAELAE